MNQDTRFQRWHPSTLLAWSPILLTIAWVLISGLLEKINKSWFCVAVNPGGRELVCGFDHSVAPIQTLTLAYVVAYLVLAALSLRALLQKRLSKFGLAGVLINFAFLCAGIYFWYVFSQDDSP